MNYDDGDYYSLAIYVSRIYKHLNSNVMYKSLNLETLGQNEYGCMLNGSSMIVS